jgi:hypothetical protein
MKLKLKNETGPFFWEFIFSKDNFNGKKVMFHLDPEVFDGRFRFKFD